ncbi:MAG TPA: SDR family NAD(P)-dependent oxidoreductase [Nitrospiraceae bacterium]|nr:SDR family NAD(P)-dependent oxidoreductase [Nitrospiraceae bacterium]
MDLELEGKICVVTGASRGIGLAITRALVAEGAVVVAGARTIDNLNGIEGVTSVVVDLGSRDGPGQLVKRAVDDHGRIDVLVNNVGGVRLRLKGFLGTSDEEFEWAMNLNFFAALRATRAAVTFMIDRGGAIVNVASVNAFSLIPAPSTMVPLRPRLSISPRRSRRSSGRTASASMMCRRAQ